MGLVLSSDKQYVNTCLERECVNFASTRPNNMSAMENAYSCSFVRMFFVLGLLEVALPAIMLISLLSPAESTTTVLKNETDRLALLAFKDGIYGDPNQALSSWNDSFHFCTWAGITCSKRHPQRVTALNLTGRGLVGVLSPHIANLSFLRSINLSYNSFQGHIPQEISRFFKLQRLGLRSNSFSGEIPKNLTNCLELRRIDLRANELVGKIPFDLGCSLPKLQVLDLGRNNLSGHIPASLGNLSSLTNLYLSRNRLDGSIPSDLGRISKLQILGVFGNELSGTILSSLYNCSSIIALDAGFNNLHGSLPPELGLSLPNLEWFSVSKNQFTGPLPNSLGNATRMRHIGLDENNFTGLVPMNLGSLQGLKRLQLRGNELTGDLSFIPSLTNSTQLSLLHLGNNKFNGKLPNSIANFSIKFSRLVLANNQIFGAIPEGIGDLSNLITLCMSGNLFTGTIPKKLRKLQKLEKLALHQNKLSGQIPESLGNLTKLSRLGLSMNNLQGKIPSSLGNCQYLQVLLLSQNNLVGSIPEQVLNALSLFHLDVASNSLSGPLLFNGDELKNLVHFDVSKNKFAGEIPTTLGNCLTLEVLLLGGNMLHGIIPSSLSALKGLQTLDLSQNKLSGQIPKLFEELPQLRSLNLSFNNLEGEVPMRGFFQNRKAFSIVGNGKLCGGLPMLKLPPCPRLASEEERMNFPRNLTILIIVLGSLGALLLLSCAVAIRYCLKRPVERSSFTSSLGSCFLEVTYADIFKATDGFSSLNLIGEGSFGFVYKGLIERINKIVAIKVLKFQQQRASKSFIAECKALRSIRHRNIVNVLTVCSSIDFRGNDFKAFVFYYMSNGSLDMWLHPNTNEDNQIRKLNFAQRINIAIDVACALDYLHHHCPTRVVHCDLKPSNILLDNDMVAHVSDFGLARLFMEDPVDNIQSSSSLVKGSIGYIAPEYGMGSDVSLHGDMYSYGILLLELFTGKKPTDDMFKDNVSLHQFAKRLLPNQVMEVIDLRLLSEEIGVLVKNDDINMRGKVQECLTTLVSIGVSCSSNLPNEQMEIKDVVKELHGVKELYLGISKN